MNKKKLKVDIVSDLVCPWCVIGYKRLEKALELLKDEVEAEINWHPYLLYGHLPDGGQHYRSLLMSKYGMSHEQVTHNRKIITQFGKELGFDFDYFEEMKTYNSVKAHQLVYYAREFNKAHEMKMRLFTAFFAERQPLDNIDVLVEQATHVGLNTDDCRKILTNNQFEAKVRAEAKHWANLGVQSIPTYVFNDQHGIQGSQEPEVFAKAIREIIT